VRFASGQQNGDQAPPRAFSDLAESEGIPFWVKS
jgi:hypothetical protein